MAMSLVEADRRLTAPGEFFEIVEVNIRGVPTKTWRNCPGTLTDILMASRGHGDLPFLVYEDESMTFEEHFVRSAQLANALRTDFGVGKGDRVAIAMRNLPEWSVAFWGASAAGAVVVPLNAWWSGDELAYGLSDSGSKVLICDRQREERLSDRWKDLDALEGVVVARSEVVEGGHVRFAEVLEEITAGTRLPGIDVVTDDDATIFYTSGTTGRPKGAVGTHRNICTNPISLFYVMMRAALRGGEGPTGAGGPVERSSHLLSVPLFHATGCHSVLVANAAGGGKLVMMQRWDAGRALELIERERITVFGGVPSMALQVLNHPDLSIRDTSSVRSVAYGGAPAPPELVRRIKSHFPVGTASNGYGLTETSSVATMNSGDDYLARPDSVGPPVPVVEVKVVDAGGQALPLGAVGELWIKGPNVVRGYWAKPEATAASFSDGWLHTGDLAKLDPEGFVYIVDRAKDMLIRGGENVYCVEIEAALYEHPGVAEAAVIGIPDEVLGEEVGAVVQLRPGATVDHEALRAHVASKLAAFKVPSRIWFTDEALPRNPAGKILKRRLRDDLIGTD